MAVNDQTPSYSSAPTRAELVAALTRAVQRQGTLTVMYTHAIAQHIGLSATEFEFCDVLQDQGPCTAGQLAKLCGLSTGGVTGLVDRLERHGFVRRQADPRDRRRVIIAAVESGEAVDSHIQTIRRLYQPLSQGFNELLENYSDTELATILDFMARSSELISALHPQLAGKQP
jgi:DNA-binding MarR family transcriptional regulator